MNYRQTTLLVVEAEAIALQNLEQVLTTEGYRVLSAANGTAALALLDREPVDVVLTDVRMHGIDGMEVLTHARNADPDVEVILLSSQATLEAAVEAMRRGAFYYIAKPFRLDEVRKVVREAADKVQLKRENRDLRAQLDTVRGRSQIITRNSSMLKLLDTARGIAAPEYNVLVSGESGTGKELLARFVHKHSRRAQGPFLAINCGAFSEDLLANELFGHEKGAFTGAVESKTGLIASADGGTLFLDEVTEMPPPMQVKLLRALQEREILPLGATRARRIDVRFIAATNRDIKQAVREGSLRQDIYFRLNVVTLHLPPLTSRSGDIPLLARHFLDKYAVLMQKPVTDIAATALELLEAYGFPGNVRELENIIARGVALAPGDTIEIEQLPDDLRQTSLRTFRPEKLGISSLAEQEKTYLSWVLEQTGGNRSQAARILGIDRVSLWRKLKKLGITP